MSRLTLPAVLLVLGLLPVLASAFRITLMIRPDLAGPGLNDFAGLDLPVLMHVVGGFVFVILGAFQFMPGPRRAAHRRFGAVTMAAGLLAGLSVIWLVLARPEPSLMLNAMRLVFGVALVLAIAMGLRAIRVRDVTRHRAWMIRAYAMGLAGTTQAALIGIWPDWAGRVDASGDALVITVAFALNLVWAEWRLSRPV